MSTTGGHDRAKWLRDALAAMGCIDEPELASTVDRLLAVIRDALALERVTFVEGEPALRDDRTTLDVAVWQRGRKAGVLRLERASDAARWAPDEELFGQAGAVAIAAALEARDRRRAEHGRAMALRATNDVVWDWDMVRDVVEWHGPLAETYRFTPDQVELSAAWWLDRVHADDRERVKASIEEALTSGATAWMHQYRWVRGDGTVALVVDRCTIARAEGGAPVRMVGSMRDATARAELQERMSLSDRMASIGTLAGGVAHEINNPLTYVTANLTCLAMGIEEGRSDRSAALELVREALDGAERVKRIVRDLQTFARAREDGLEVLDVREAIEASIGVAWNEMRHRAQLHRELGAVPPVRANRARLGQVMLNLLINAAHAVPEGSADSHQIRVRTSTDAQGAAVIEIADTGCGIPEAIRPRVFEPFFTTKPVGQGTGLGLSICHSVVTAIGGRIEIDSPAGAGCVVRIWLPGVSPRAEEEAASSPHPAGPARRRILLVDDEAPIHRAMRRLLEPAHQLIAVDSGERALEEVLGGAEYDVILCDLMMPRMSGMELYNRLATAAPALTRRMIFITGGAFSQGARDFLQTCDRPVLDKPIDTAALARAIAEI
jgi:signal transduction histidine kinase/CheY-like chemotaxis protein